MRKSPNVARWFILASLLLLALAPRADAQAPPPLCNPAAGDFEKTVSLFDDVDLSGSYTPGDIIEYVVLLCNSGAAACRPGWTDNLDTLLGDPANLDKVDIPGRECPTSGGTLCEVGPSRTGPFSPATTTRCGELCGGGAPDNLAFVVPGSALLPPGSCFRWTIRAVIGPLAATECLCNQSTVIIDSLGTTENSNDPDWASLEGTPPVSPGCLDTDTCPGGVDPGTGACTLANTCVRAIAEADLSTSLKCIDSTAPCGEDVIKAPLSSVAYQFEIRNNGTLPATAIAISDNLSFLSDLGTPCLDITPDPVPSAVTCAPCACPTASATYTAPTLNVSIPSLAAGCTATFSISAPVDAGAAGVCVNNWELMFGSPPRLTLTNQPQFRVDNAATIEATKCIDEPTGCTTPVTRAPGAAVRYVMSFENTGNLDALDVLIIDDLGAMGPTCGISTSAIPSCVPRAALCPGATVIPGTPPPSFSCTISTMVPGCIVDLVIDGTLGPGASGTCCNQADVSYRDANGPGSASTPDACFSVSGTSALEVTKTASAATVPPGGTVDFDIVIHNNSATPISAGGVTLSDTFPACFNALGTAGAPCAPGLVGCPLGTPCPGTCVYGPGGRGFTLTGFALAADDGSPGGADELTVQMQVTAGLTPGPCTNTANGTAGPTTVSDTATVTIGDVILEVVKTASASSVAPGGSVDFTITATNNGTSTLRNCNLTDDLRGSSCMTLDTGSCVYTPAIAPARENCGAPTANLLEVIGPGFDLAPSATQTITFTVTAGATPIGSCLNTVDVVCGTETGSGSDDFRIGAAGCDLDAVLVDLVPTTPARIAPWIYTLDCAPDPDRVDPAYPVRGRVAVSGDTGAGDPFTTSTAPNTIEYVQRSCGCTDVIRLAKDDVTEVTGSTVRLFY